MPDQTPTDQTTPTPAPAVKPGYQTTEFYFSLLATLLTALYASGLLTSSVSLAIAGIAATVLTSLGYKVARTIAKSGAAPVIVLAILVFASSSGCGAKAGAIAAGRGFIDCMTPAAKASAAELAPAFGAVLRGALESNGKIDRAQLGAVAAPLKSSAARCALDAAIGLLLRPVARLAGAPMSSELEPDRADVLDAYAEIRTTMWGGAELRSSP